VKLEGVAVRLRRRALLEGVSLEIVPGRFTAVLGPNGAGKSTLLRVLAGELAPSEGRAALEGLDLHRWDPSALARRRAILRQRFAVAFDLSVLDVVALGRVAHGDVQGAEPGALRALAAVGLAGFAGRRYATLSGGEQQRVHLARCLLQLEPGPHAAPGPHFLLLDEPTASLDLRHRHEVLALARARAAEGLGVLAVLHEPTLAQAHADDVIVLDGGRVVAAGRAGDVLVESLFARVFRVEVEVHETGGRRRIDVVGPLADP
jgi:iron complex transport system ATP-binding protein